MQEFQKKDTKSPHALIHASIFSTDMSSPKLHSYVMMRGNLLYVIEYGSQNEGSLGNDC